MREGVAWRGVVVDGTVWAWPMLLMDHNTAFACFSALSNYTCRWRQWSPGERIDFDAGCSAEDRALVEVWVAAANSVTSRTELPTLTS